MPEAGGDQPPLAKGSSEVAARSRAIDASVRTQAVRPETGRALPTQYASEPLLPSAKVRERTFPGGIVLASVTDADGCVATVTGPGGAGYYTLPAGWQGRPRSQVWQNCEERALDAYISAIKALAA